MSYHHPPPPGTIHSDLPILCKTATDWFIAQCICLLGGLQWQIHDTFSDFHSNQTREEQNPAENSLRFAESVKFPPRFVNSYAIFEYSNIFVTPSNIPNIRSNLRIRIFETALTQLKCMPHQMMGTLQMALVVDGMLNLHFCGMLAPKMRRSINLCAFTIL